MSADPDTTSTTKTNNTMNHDDECDDTNDNQSQRSLSLLFKCSRNIQRIDREIHTLKQIELPSQFASHSQLEHLQEKTNETKTELLLDIKKFQRDISDQIQNKQISQHEFLEKFLQKQSDYNQDQFQLFGNEISQRALETEFKSFESKSNAHTKDIKKDLSNIHSDLQTHNQNIKRIYHHHALQILHTLHQNYTFQRKRHGFYTLKKYSNSLKELRIHTQHQISLMKKFIKFYASGQKRKGFIAWKDFLKHDRMMEKKRLKACDVLYKWIRHFTVHDRLDKCFHIWHRFSIMDKVDLFEIGSSTSTSSSSSPPTASTSITTNIHVVEEEEEDDDEHTQPNYGITQAIQSFGKDIDGGLFFLARELHKLKKRDIAQLHKTIQMERMLNHKNTNDLYDKTQQKIQTTETQLKQEISNLKEDHNQQFYEVKQQMEQEQIKLRDVSTIVTRLEKTHSKQIEFLFQEKEQTKHTLQKQENDQTIMKSDIQLLLDNQQKSNVLLTKLLQDLSSLKTQHVQSQHKFDQMFSQMQNDFEDLSRKVHDDHNHHLAKLDSNLHKTQSHLDTIHQSVKTDIQNIHEKLYIQHGIRKPSLDRMVYDCLLYEQTAKEKNYVVNIHSVYNTLQPNNNKMGKYRRRKEKLYCNDSSNKKESKNEEYYDTLDEFKKNIFQQHLHISNVPSIITEEDDDDSKNNTPPHPPLKSKEKAINLPQEMSSFAFDYASWIAYQSDQETLERIVAGQNPEEIVYFDDDEILKRRRFYLDNLLVEMEQALDNHSRNVEDDDDKEEKGEGECVINNENDNSYDNSYTNHKRNKNINNKKSASTSSSIGSLRMEARNRFLARLMDAVESALSKHDQILVSSSTRLGRRTATTAATRTRPTCNTTNINNNNINDNKEVIICVACDRPLRHKASRESQSQQIQQQVHNNNNNNIISSRTKRGNHSTNLSQQTTMKYLDDTQAQQGYSMMNGATVILEGGFVPGRTGTAQNPGH